MLSYIYLLREREFLRLNENIYKIGKTEQEPNNRLSGYPKGTEVILFINTDNCHTMEDKLIYIFKNIFIQRTDIGKEYFEGDKDYMVKIICDVINANNNNKIFKINNVRTESINNSIMDNDVNSNKIENILSTKSNNADQDLIKKNELTREENIITNINKPQKNKLMLNNKIQNNSDIENKCYVESKYNCSYCKYQTNDRKAWYLHKNGKKHKQREHNDNKKDNIELIKKQYEIEILKLKLKLETMENEKKNISVKN